VVGLSLPFLSYALIAFRPGQYLRCRDALGDLRDLGFRWVTFMPTWAVADEVPLRIGAGPGLEEMAAAIAEAVQAGFSVKLEPHLDWQATLSGGPYEWRRRMYLDPSRQYAERVLAPLFGLLGEAAAAGAGCAFSLGSELDVSLAAFGAQWEKVFEIFRAAYPGIAIGHNLNHDTLASSPDLRKSWTVERVRRGLPPLDRRTRRMSEAAMHRYLGRLDYAGFSFYPNAKSGRSDGWWRGATTPLHTRVVGRTLQKEAQKLTSRLRRAAGDRPQFAIGEYGLGCADPSKPWHFDALTLRESGATEMRRKFYLGLLDCLRAAPHLFGSHPVTFWTATHFDFLGAHGYPGYEAFRDDVLRNAVKAYNTGH
jgi:hypothetical protein